MYTRHCWRLHFCQSTEIDVMRHSQSRRDDFLSRSCGLVTPHAQMAVSSIVSLVRRVRLMSASTSQSNYSSRQSSSGRLGNYSVDFRNPQHADMTPTVCKQILTAPNFKPTVHISLDGREPGHRDILIRTVYLINNRHSSARCKKTNFYWIHLSGPNAMEFGRHLSHNRR